MPIPYHTSLFSATFDAAQQHGANVGAVQRNLGSIHSKNVIRMPPRNQQAHNKGLTVGGHMGQNTRWLAKNKNNQSPVAKAWICSKGVMDNDSPNQNSMGCEPWNQWSFRHSFESLIFSSLLLCSQLHDEAKPLGCSRTSMNLYLPSLAITSCFQAILTDHSYLWFMMIFRQAFLATCRYQPSVNHELTTMFNRDSTSI